MLAHHSRHPIFAERREELREILAGLHAHPEVAYARIISAKGATLAGKIFRPDLRVPESAMEERIRSLDRLAAEGRPVNPVMVSRSDSTLRGHYPVETDVIAEQLGPFDAHFLVPAFFEGERITRDSVHYLMVNGAPVPVHETEFARDSVFGYSHSYLPDYVEEKTGGRIRADQVQRFLLDDVRGDSLTRLMALPVGDELSALRY